MKGARWALSMVKQIILTWDLSVMLEALLAPPFELLEVTSLKLLSYMMPLLLALTSVRCVSFQTE